MALRCEHHLPYLCATRPLVLDAGGNGAYFLAGETCATGLPYRGVEHGLATGEGEKRIVLTRRLLTRVCTSTLHA